MSALVLGPGARDSPPERLRSTLAGLVLSPYWKEGEALEELGRALQKAISGFPPSLWKVQSDCTMTLKLVFQVVSYNFGLGRQEGGDRVSL